jgi:hypothetical protein
VQRAGKPASGVFVVLVPANPGAGRDAWRRNQSDSDGSFEFPHVAAGDYTLVAIEQGWTLEWARPEVMARYLPRGVRITAPADARRIDLKDPLEAQPK